MMEIIGGSIVRTCDISAIRLGEFPRHPVITAEQPDEGFIAAEHADLTRVAEIILFAIVVLDDAVIGLDREIVILKGDALRITLAYHAA